MNVLFQNICYSLNLLTISPHSASLEYEAILIGLHIYLYKYIDYFHIKNRLYLSFCFFHSTIVFKILLLPNTFNIVPLVSVEHSIVKNILQRQSAIFLLMVIKVTSPRATFYVYFYLCAHLPAFIQGQYREWELLGHRKIEMRVLAVLSPSLWSLTP